MAPEHWATAETIGFARLLSESLAGNQLLPRIAKLYSQHTRLRAGQRSLGGWRPDEASDRLSDACRLVEAGLIEQEQGIEYWERSIARAAELLEWLAHPQLNAERLPLRLLAAAAYQLAGYPARSASLLQATTDVPESEIVRAFLRADFTALQSAITAYWERQHAAERTNQRLDASSDALSARIVDETVAALGVIYAELRWGSDQRIDLALKRLAGITGVFAYSRDPYSWLLSRLTAEVAKRFLQSALRKHTGRLTTGLSDEGRTALERYVRLNFLAGRALAWPSQIVGLDRLTVTGSFVLCTPTGSGKTTIAELAILTALYGPQRDVASEATEQRLIPRGPIALYLVPSRALAAEVESRLARVLRFAAAEDIVVTGLYGGTDWGPTDAWLTASERAVVICTYEKAEALLRFLGPLFLSRVRLLVIDEAHQVAFAGQDASMIRVGESRALRLEMLGARLMSYLSRSSAKVIALSAVASGIEEPLARWVSADADAVPVTTRYRSTRQLVGRLMCLATRGFEIRYDVLDGASLNLSGDGYEAPFVPSPFPPAPQAPAWDREGPDKRLRPFVLWAALHLAAPDETGQSHSVLVSISQGVGGYAQDFLDLLTYDWADQSLPSFFAPPPEHNQALWERCLASCADYFGTASREYQLLTRGIAVHHGKMPGLLARLLVETIEARIVRVVVATSTLSEGINLPFETVLLPSLKRWGGESISTREFGNLVGRAGRPGYGVEGRSLVVLASQRMARTTRDAWAIGKTHEAYTALINGLLPGAQITQGASLSPLAELLRHLYDVWRSLFGGNADEFLAWLEQCAPTSDRQGAGESLSRALDMVDSLDGLLLSAVVESETVEDTAQSALVVEDRLKDIWQRTFAAYVGRYEQLLVDSFIRRGKALATTIYPDANERTTLYRTSLPPSSGHALIRLSQELWEYWRTGRNYANWSIDQRFEFVEHTAMRLSAIRAFEIRGTVGSSRARWQDVLRWWLHPSTARHAPGTKQISAWYDFINTQFTYRLNWGIGSCIALATERLHRGEIRETTLEQWPETHLPWIVLWLKELISWGTLDPVAAFLLGRRAAYTRHAAEELAHPYYAEHSNGDDPLDATQVRRWAESSFARTAGDRPLTPPQTFPVTLLRDFSRSQQRNFRVFAASTPSELLWIDIAGFPLAKSPQSSRMTISSRYDATLNVDELIVLVAPYV